MSPILSVPVFGSGIVLEGSSDAERTDELLECDGYDIGPRGQLVAASDVSAYVNASISGTSLDAVYGLMALAVPQLPMLLYVGDAAGETVIGIAGLDGNVPGGLGAGTAHSARFIATFAMFPYVSGGVQLWLVLVAIAARQAFDARAGLGLFAVIYGVSGGAGSIDLQPISDFDALGTGPDGEFAGGSNAKMLFPRIVLAYGSLALLAGFDDADATTGNGPNRVMFSNLGNPLKYGFDTKAPEDDETDRPFVDSDAITVGGEGAVLRAGIVWNQRAWFGATDGLYFVEGYGRDSIKANGAQAVEGTANVIGPHALIEGPDKLLHGVGDDGHWIYDGAQTTPVGNKLRGFDSKSLGYWDLIWTNPLRTLASYPGQTNQDLVWMLADKELGQVLIGIPYCNATVGWGEGSDTVVLKYHVATGGYTRQVFTGKIILSAARFRREHLAERAQFLAGTTSLPTSIVKYRAKATSATSPVLPATLPVATFGEYAPFGPNGVGVMRKRYVTVAWETGALPLAFTFTPTVDGQAMPAVKLTIGSTEPSTPANGDVWVDTSGTDTNLGNGTAGAIVVANAADYIVKVWITTWGKWVNQPSGGQQGRRVTVPIAFDPRRGTRLKVRVVCTAASGRYQVENFAEDPAMLRADK